MKEAILIPEFTLIYSLPQSYDFYSHSPSSKNQEFKFCDFDGQEYNLSGESKEIDIDAVKSLELHFNTALQSTTLEHYTDMFLQSYSLLNSGELDKIILSKLKKVEFETKQILDYMIYLKASNPNAFVYLVSCPELGTWIGATPEKLVEGKENSFKTMALAGTQKFSKESEPNWTKKEVTEHEIVANEIESILTQLNSNFTRGKRQNQKSGQVVHLKTEFEFETENVQEFISHLHPSPAISGKPKAQSIEHIKSIELHERGIYTGYLGFELDGTHHYFVNLRCMQVFKESACLYLGGGLTKDSVLEEEWAETELKAKSLLQPLEKMQKFAGNDF